MEKFIKTLSTIITTILFYGIAAYTYMTYKGFVYTNGTFTIVKQAQARQNERPTGFANKIDENVALNFKDDNAIGDENAPLTLYEFSSLGCGHCANFHLNYLPDIEKEFISQGKLKVVFVNFPLDKKSEKGAMLAECLKSPQREKYINTVFMKQKEWMLSFRAEDLLKKYAIDETFSAEDAAKCLKDKELETRIIADRQEAMDKLNMQGTPAFLFSADGVNEIIYGIPKYEKLKSYIESRLK